MWHHWYGDSGRSLCIVSYTPVWQQFIYFSLRTNLPTWTALWAVPAQSPPFLLPPSSWPRLPWRPGREGVLHRGPAHRLEGTERRQGGGRSGRSRGKTKRGIFFKKNTNAKKNIADANTANLEKPEHCICRHWCCFQLGGLEGGAGLQSRDPGTILRAMIKCRQCHIFLRKETFFISTLNSTAILSASLRCTALCLLCWNVPLRYTPSKGVDWKVSSGRDWWNEILNWRIIKKN